MSSASPTRSRLIALGEERRAMHEGYVFLDEKCLLLAAEMLAELKCYETLKRAGEAARQSAQKALMAALQRHGIDGLSVYPALPGEGIELSISRSSLLGVALRRIKVRTSELVAPPAVFPSPEAESCRAAFSALAVAGATLAASAGNLLRLHQEYRRTVRRGSAIHDVVLPELERDISQIDSRLDEMEREEAMCIRGRRSI